MAMDRRGFLTRLLGGAVALAASKTEVLYALEAQGVPDPERVLWVPEEKVIYTPEIVAPVNFIQPAWAPKMYAPGQIIRPRNIKVTLDTGRVEYYRNYSDVLPYHVDTRRELGDVERIRFMEEKRLRLMYGDRHSASEMEQLVNDRLNKQWKGDK